MPGKVANAMFHAIMTAKAIKPPNARHVRQSRRMSPLQKLQTAVQLQEATALAKGLPPQGPQAPQGANPFTAAPTQTPQGLLALLSQKGAPASPNGMV